MGLLVGLCVAGLAFGYVVPMLSRPLVIFTDGFESGLAPECRGLVGRPGIWSGDESRVVPADQGVMPAEGRRMLRLLRADYPGKVEGDSYISDTFRVIDLQPYRDLVAGGVVVAKASARCNAAGYAPGEEYAGSVCIYAFDQATAARLHQIPDVDLPRESLATAQRRQACFDRTPGTWQSIDCELRLPFDADFLVIRVGVSHGPAAQRQPTFTGHYLDDVVVSLQESINEPHDSLSHEPPESACLDRGGVRTPDAAPVGRRWFAGGDARPPSQPPRAALLQLPRCRDAGRQCPAR